MNKLNFDSMSRDELAHYMVAHRDTPDGIEARRVYIRRMAEKAKRHGIDLYRLAIDKEDGLSASILLLATRKTSHFQYIECSM